MRNLTSLMFLFLIACNHPESEEYSRDATSQNLNKQEQILSSPKGNSTNIANYETSTLYKVVGVKDGDTYELFIDNSTFVVRSAHIDCPEKKQPFGQNAKQFASDMCFGKYVMLKHNNKYDRNHRLIAEVILEDDINLNKLLVENGLAWHFKKYSKDEEYAELENIARQKRIGLWSDINSIAPWEWRHK